MANPGDYQITGGMPDGTDSTTLTLRAFYGNATVDQTIFVSKAKQGTAGNPGVSGTPGSAAVQLLVTKPAMMVLTYAEGTPVDPTFTNIDGFLSVLNGPGNDVTYACTLSAVTVGCTATVNTALNVPVAAHAMGYYRVTAMAADTATITLNVLYQGFTYSTTVTLAKAKGGYEIVGSLPVTNLFEGRVVMLTTDGKLYRYHGTGWTAAVPTVDLTGLLTDAQIMSQGKGPALNSDPMLADPTAWEAAYVGNKPIFETVAGVNDVVCGPQYPTFGYSIRNVKGVPVNPAKSYRVSAYVKSDTGTNGFLYLRAVTYDATGVVGVDMGGGSTTVPADGVWRKYAAFVTPTAPFIGPELLLNYGGTAGKMYARDIRVEEAIAGDLLVAGTVTAAAIAAHTIDATKILANTLTASEIGAGAITASEIAANTITGNKLFTASIITATAQINDGVIISAKIGNLQVTTAQIADLTVGTTKITGNAVSRHASAVLGTNTAIPSPTSTKGTLLGCAYTPDVAASDIEIEWTLAFSTTGAAGAYQCDIDIVSFQSGVETVLWSGSIAGNQLQLVSGTCLDSINNTTARTYRIKAASNSTYFGTAVSGTTIFVQEMKK